MAYGIRVAVEYSFYCACCCCWCHDDEFGVNCCNYESLTFTNIICCCRKKLKKAAKLTRKMSASQPSTAHYSDEPQSYRQSSLPPAPPARRVDTPRSYAPPPPAATAHYEDDASVGSRSSHSSSHHDSQDCYERSCNACNTTLIVGTLYWACDPCDYDLCAPCYDGIPDAARMRMHPHTLSYRLAGPDGTCEPAVPPAPGTTNPLRAIV